MIANLSGMSYEERKETYIRRKKYKGDMITTHEYLEGRDDVNKE